MHVQHIQGLLSVHAQYRRPRPIIISSYNSSLVISKAICLTTTEVSSFGLQLFSDLHSCINTHDLANSGEITRKSIAKDGKIANFKQATGFHARVEVFTVVTMKNAVFWFTD
jgi:hypothetical protein